METVKDAIAWVTAALKDETDCPSFEARMIVGHVTDLDDVHIIMNSSGHLADDEIIKIREITERRLNHEPLAYILGSREFYGREFITTPDTLIPRSDTEILVETVLENGPHGRILDMCTGTGCIGITLKAETDCDVTISDISERTLDVAIRNAEKLVDGNVKAVISNLFDKIHDKYDIIVSNPPYLTEEWIEQTEEQVRKEPYIALFGFGDDGLDLIRKIIECAPEHLTDGGKLYLECDYRQTAYVARYMERFGFTSTHIVRDLGDRERVVWGTYEGKI